MLSLPNGTLLVLTPLSGFASMQLTPYAARGLSQTLELLKPSGQDQWTRRDVNGWKRSVADTRFRKYISEITCTDGETPCLDDAWIGEVVTVDCACELSYVTGATPARPVVTGSPRSQGTVTYYRPQLTMIVEDIMFGFKEWGALYDWKVRLEEV